MSALAIPPAFNSSDAFSISELLGRGISKSHQQLNNNKLALANTSNAIAAYPKFLHKPISKLPIKTLAPLLSINLGESLLQILQEFSIQFTPRAIINGVAIRNSPYVILDEAAVEIPEYLALYIGPAVLGLGLALASQALDKNIPHFELLGSNLYELEKQIGKKISTGTVKPIEINKFTRQQYNKIAFNKFFNNIAVVLACIGAEIAAVSSRPAIIDKLLDKNNFYEISGLEIDPDEADDGELGVKQSYRNLKYGLASIPISLGLVLGAKGLTSKLGFENKAIWGKIGKRFDLGKKFSLSRTPLALMMVAPIFAYATTARNKAEAIENLFRITAFSIPAILFFKQFVGTLSVYTLGKIHGLGNIIGNPFKIWHKEVIGKDGGKRDPLDFSFGDINKSSNNEYSGDIAKIVNKKIEAGKLTKKKGKSILKQIHWSKNYAGPYIFALPTGLLVALYNFRNTQKLHNQQNQEIPITSESNNWYMKVIHKAAEEALRFQQKYN